MPSRDGHLTRREGVFAQHMASTGDARYSAEKAGYRHPVQDSFKNMRKPAVNAEIAALCQAELHNDLRPLANRRLRTILENDDIAPQHHIAAAKVVLAECRNFVDPATGKAVSDMTPGELQAAIARIDQMLGKATAETLEPVGSDVFE